MNILLFICFLFVVNLTKYQAASNLRNLYKVLQESQKVHGRFIRPQRDISVGDLSDNDTRKTIRNFGEKLRIPIETVISSEEEEMKQNQENSSTNSSPESWLTKFYQKRTPVVPRRINSEKVKLQRVELTTEVLPNMIDNNDNNNNVEYVVFYDYETQNPSHDVLLFEESENSLPETDFNIIKLYNKLLEKSQKNKKLENIVSKSSDEEIAKKNTKANKKVKNKKQDISLTTSVKDVKNYEVNNTKDVTVENKDRINVNNKKENYKYLLRSFFQPQFEVYNSPLKPFTSEYDFKFSDPVKKIQSEMKEILRETSNKIQQSQNLRSADDFQNVELLIKRANLGKVVTLKK